MRQRKRLPWWVLFPMGFFGVFCGCCGFLMLMVNPDFATAKTKLPKEIEEVKRSGVAIAIEDLASSITPSPETNAAQPLLDGGKAYQAALNGLGATDKTLFEQSTQGVVQDAATLERILNRFSQATTLYANALKRPASVLSAEQLRKERLDYTASFDHLVDLYGARAGLFLALGKEDEALPFVQDLGKGARLAASSNFGAEKSMALVVRATLLLKQAALGSKESDWAKLTAIAKDLPTPPSAGVLFRQWVPVQFDLYTRYSADCTIPPEQGQDRRTQVSFQCSISKDSAQQIFDGLKLRLVRDAKTLHPKMDQAKTFDEAELALVEPIRNLNQDSGAVAFLVNRYYDQTLDWQTMIDKITQCRSAEMNRRALVCTLWAKGEQKKTGMLPTALSDDLGVYATDPFGGKPLIYSIRDGEPNVTSVGRPVTKPDANSSGG